MNEREEHVLFLLKMGGVTITHFKYKKILENLFNEGYLIVVDNHIYTQEPLYKLSKRVRMFLNNNN